MATYTQKFLLNLAQSKKNNEDTVYDVGQHEQFSEDNKHTKRDTPN